MDEPKGKPVTQSPRGRPRRAVQGTTVCAWVEASHYDQLVKLANRQDTSVSALVRQMLVLRLK